MFCFEPTALKWLSKTDFFISFSQYNATARDWSFDLAEHDKLVRAAGTVCFPKTGSSVGLIDSVDYKSVH